MATSILVVTHDVPFGEFIRQSLEETGRFGVFVTKEAKKAVSYLLETDCQLAFIDSGSDRQEILAIGRRLRETKPALHLIVITEAGWQLALEELSPDDYLSKPFYMPDLLEAVNRIHPQASAAPRQPAAASPAAESMPPWLANVNRAAQLLTRLTLESSAQAALITHRKQLWSYAGQLPQAAAHELADTVNRYWDTEEQNDLVRFVRLASTEAEHMLYATHLAAGSVLALVFDAETPFSTIRAQASQLARSLAVLPVEDDQPDLEAVEDEESPKPVFLNDILADVPPPNPAPEQKTGLVEDGGNRIDRVRDTVRRLFAPAVESEVEEDLESTRVNPSLADTAPMPARRGTQDEGRQMETQPHVSVQMDEDLDVTVKSKAARRAEPERLQDENLLLQPDAPTAPRKIVLEPVTASVYDLGYVCLLVPRFPHHHLIGDLSDRVGEWVRQICIAFGWRLEFISVRPEHLLWIANVPPATSPAYLMRILRQHTSEKIFTDFPRFKKENPSGDFWAPGYLIMGGSQPPPAQLIKDYIADTRQRQGFPPSNRP